MMKKPFLSEINMVFNFANGKWFFLAEKLNLFAFLYHIYWHYIITISIDIFSQNQKINSLPAIGSLRNYSIETNFKFIDSYETIC